MKFKPGQIIDWKTRSLLGDRVYRYIILGPGENHGISLVYCLHSPRDHDVGQTFSMNDYVLNARGTVIDEV
jgi:hypothetical protein